MRAFRAALHEISPADPFTPGAVAAVLLATALRACTLPARCAMRVDPAATLRQEV